MSVSEAQKRANAKYNAKKIADGTNKRLGLTIKTTDFDAINNYCVAVGMSKAAFIVAAARYCIDHNIDLKTERPDA